MGMFDTGLFQNPFQNPMQNQIDIQMLQRQVVPQQQEMFIDKVSNTVQQLSQDEQYKLASDPSFIEARAIYDRNFIDFLSGRFKTEFEATNNGQNSAKNLFEATNNAIASIKEQSRLEASKIAKLSKLLEDNPNLLERLENGEGDIRKA